MVVFRRLDLRKVQHTLVVASATCLHVTTFRPPGRIDADYVLRLSLDPSFFRIVSPDFALPVVFSAFFRAFSLASLVTTERRAFASIL